LEQLASCSQVHVSKEVGPSDAGDWAPVIRVDDWERSQMEVSEHAEHFWQLVSDVHNIRLFDHVGTQVNQLLTELRANRTHILHFALRRPQIHIEVMPVEHILR